MVDPSQRTKEHRHRVPSEQQSLFIGQRQHAGRYAAGAK